jgi:hypothetical protein
MTVHPLRDDDDLDWQPLAEVVSIGARRWPRKVYLAGPMRGRPSYNFPAFEAATEALRELGYEVISPAEHDLEEGFDPDLTLEAQDFDLREALTWDLVQLLQSEGVVVLPGWGHSAGALAEVAVARAAGVPVFDLEELVA